MMVEEPTASDDLREQSVMNTLCRKTLGNPFLPGITMQQELALYQLISGEGKLPGRFFGLGLWVSFVCDA